MNNCYLNVFGDQLGLGITFHFTGDKFIADFITDVGYFSGVLSRDYDEFNIVVQKKLKSNASSTILSGIAK